MEKSRIDKLILGSIKIYQVIHGKIGFNNVCRFIPSCSEYTYQAIDKYGILKGIILGLKRILRCHPFCHGGHDPLH
jgi:hypothetical protein